MFLLDHFQKFWLPLIFSRSFSDGAQRSEVAHQLAVGPGAPLGQHALIRTRQPALTCTYRNLLRVTEIILHYVCGAIDGVQHAPANPTVSVYFIIFISTPSANVTHFTRVCGSNYCFYFNYNIPPTSSTDSNRLVLNVYMFCSLRQFISRGFNKNVSLYK